MSAWFSPEFEDGTLVNDLALELVEQGHEVLVYAQDWDGRKKSPEIFEAHGVKVAWQPHAGQGRNLGRLGLPVKWLFSSLLGWRNYRKLMKEFEPEGLICFSPAVISFWVVRHFYNRKSLKSLIIQWDFFPKHHAQIGLVPSGPVEKLLMELEQWLLNRFDFVGHMSERNIRFFRENYIKCTKTKQVILPIWGKKDRNECSSTIDDIRKKYDLPLDKIIVVFGGQLSAGRGLGEILEFVRTAEEKIPNSYFVIIGSGKLRKWIQDKIVELELGNIVLKERIPRNQYQEFLRACDIGLVSTQGGTGVPTFPSKSIDYMRNKLPIIASTEDTTDFGEKLEAAGAGIYVPAGHAEELLTSLAELCADKERRLRMGEKSLAYFLENHDVTEVASKLVNYLAR